MMKSQKYISFQEFEEKYSHFLINKGDIVSSCSGATWGKTALFNIDDKIMLNTSTLRLRFFNDLADNKYLYYLTKSDFFKNQLKIHQTGQQPNYGFFHYSLIVIPIPPLEEQKTIVAKLDQAFAAIDQAKANIEKNIANAKELFENYLQNVFENDKLEKKEWGELCDFVRGPFGGSLKKDVFKESGYVVYEQKHAIHDHFNQLRYFIDENKFNEMKRFEVFPGDLIMSCSGVTLGRIAVIPEGIPRGIINQALLKLTPKKNISSNYIKYWVRSNVFQKIIFEYSGGAAIPNVPSAKILKQIKIPCPNFKEQEIIVDKIDTFSNYSKRLIEIYQQKLTNLEELKKSILEKAFKGELS